MKYVLSAIAVSLALPATAGTLGQYTDLLVFGDSLSDGGNISAITGGTAPAPQFYLNGQFTNGDTWATELGTASSLSSPDGTNFAFGGATAVTSPANEAGLDIPDFEDQRAMYEGSTLLLGDNPLTAIWFGGNDLRVLLDEDNTQDPFAVVGAAINEIVSGINALANSDLNDLNDFLVFGLPDLGLTPGVVFDPEASAGATFLSVEFNTALQGALDFFFGANDDINVSFFDTQSFFAELLVDADALGITNIKEACLVGDNADTPDVNEFSYCGFAEDPNTYAFFDGLHPTQPIHSALAAGVKDFVTPVPLPGGLSLALGGLIVLGGVARRRKVGDA